MNILQTTVFGIPVWMIGLVVGGVVLFLVIRSRNSSSTGALGQNTSTAAPDPNIDPLTGVPYSVEEATNPATGLPAYYGGPGTDGNPPPPATPGGGGGTPSTVTIRARQTSGPLATWDQAHTGVPIRSDASQATQIGLAPFGSVVTTSGPAIAGGTDNGSNQWFPIQGGGYISAVDIQSGAMQPATGTAVRIGALRSQPTAWWPLDLTRGGR